MSRRLVALFAALVLPLVLAYGFFEFTRGIVHVDDPQLLAFAPWSVPLAFLCSWIASKGPKDAHAWNGLLGAFVGGVVGFVYFWALLITTNGMFLGFPFSVVAAWTLGASLALMLAWTPRLPVAWLVDVATVAALCALVIWQVSIELKPKPVLAVLFRPGTTSAELAQERDRLFLIDTVRGKDFPPGVFQFGEASAGPEGIRLRKGAEVDTAGVAVVFSPHSTQTQRDEVVRSALSSSLVARIAWAAPGAYEAAQAER